jgi:hypothetical protein
MHISNASIIKKLWQLKCAYFFRKIYKNNEYYISSQTSKVIMREYLIRCISASFIKAIDPPFGLLQQMTVL